MNNTIYLSHGGGPLPILRKDLHEDMYEYYQSYGKKISAKAIVIISAHYEADEFEVIYDFDGLLYDYYGFPKESYEIEYDPPKNNILGEEIIELLNKNGLKAVASKRGLDHGVFIPLKIMHPEANIPVIQISLKKGLNEIEHINLGKALAELDDILFIGSGFSFHNLGSFFDNDLDVNEKNEVFHNKLIEVLNNENPVEIEEALVNWRKLPFAETIHPRHEHLIPLHVCYGINQEKGRIGFDGEITGKRCICVEW